MDRLAESLGVGHGPIRVASGGVSPQLHTLDSILDYFRETYDMMIFSNIRNVMFWKEVGMPTFETVACEQAQEVIKMHTFQLEEHRKQEVDKIFQRMPKK